MFVDHLQMQNKNTQNSTQEKKRPSQIYKTKITNHLAKNIKHTLNPQKFYKELDKELQHNLDKMQIQIQKEIKKKALLKQIEDDNQLYRQKLKSKIQSKLQLSEKKKQKDIEKKVNDHAKFRQYKQDLAKQRVKQIKKQQLIKSLKRKKQIENQYLSSSSKVYSIPRHSSESRLNPSSNLTSIRNKKSLLESQYQQHVLNVAKKKKIFQMPNIHKKHTSSGPVQPRITQKQLDASLYIEKNVTDLQKIQQARQRKQKDWKKNLDKKQKTDKFMAEMRQIKKSQLKSKDFQWRKSVLQKDRSKSQHILRMKEQMNTKIEESRKSFVDQYKLSQQNNLEKQEQENLSKVSFKKKIKKQLQQYLKQQKINLIKKMIKQ